MANCNYSLNYSDFNILDQLQIQLITCEKCNSIMLQLQDEAISLELFMLLKQSQPEDVKRIFTDVLFMM